MKFTDYINFNFYQLKYFLALYENLNYTKAASECHISQSTLSRNILQMEQSLGLQLFIRSTVKVTPTPAARSLYENMKHIFKEYEDAILRAYQVQEGKMQPLSIGVTDGLDLMPELQPFLQQFLKRHPNFDLSFVAQKDNTLDTCLMNRTHDIVFDFFPASANDPIIESKSLLSGTFYAYMLENNPLLKKESLLPEDLAGQNLLVRSPSQGSEHVSFMKHFLEPYKVDPRFSVFVDNARELSMNIMYDNEVILADKYFIDRHCPFLHRRPIQNTISIVWVKYLSSPSIYTGKQVFINELVHYFESKNKQ